MHCALHCVNHCLCAADLSPPHADAVLVHGREALCGIVMEDLKLVPPTLLTESDVLTIRLSCQHLAATAAQAAALPASPLDDDQINPIQELIESIERTLVERENDVNTGVYGPPPLLVMPSDGLFPAGVKFPLFGRLRRDFNVDKLAGASKPPPIFLP
eukprot:COSAG03_NODE_9444_length_719_cov_0.841935_1_plen_157_part_10